MRAVTAIAVLLFGVGCGMGEIGPGDGHESGHPTGRNADGPSSASDSAAVDGWGNDARPRIETDTIETIDAAVADDVGSTGAVRADARGYDVAAVDSGFVLRPPPALPTYSHGACPMLRGGTTAATALNSNFQTGGQRRDFHLVVPPSYDGTGDWPLVVAYHWIRSSSAAFLRDGELVAAADRLHFIAVLPDALHTGSGAYAYDLTWPFVDLAGAPAELQFFDDLLACVGRQYHVDRARIHAAGVSAGALWLTHLSTTASVNRVASTVTISGGLADLGPWRMDYRAQANKFPALVLWGGPTDQLIINFDAASRRYRTALRGDNHFVVSCTHSAGHAMPPLPVPADGSPRLLPLWQFALDHPYGLPAGASPYRATGLPTSYPSWCSIAP